MKGLSYLVDEQGKKTHAVLDLEVWQATLETLLTGGAAQQVRKSGFLNELLIQMGYTPKQLGEMNLRSAEEALAPLTTEELGLDNSL